jgi:hypothetical protein
MFLIREQTCNINEVTSSRATTLTASCSEGHAQIAAMLLEARASEKLAGNEGWKHRYS